MELADQFASADNPDIPAVRSRRHLTANRAHIAPDETEVGALDPGKDACGTGFLLIQIRDQAPPHLCGIRKVFGIPREIPFLIANP